MRAKSEQDMFEPIVRGVAQAGVRVANERAVLNLIAGIPGVSNADIARRSRLGPQTTARILSDLEERGFIIRGEVLRGRRGQPATPYHMNPDAALSLGVEIGWNHVEVLLQNVSGQLLASVRRAYAFVDPAQIFPHIATEIEALLSALDPEKRARVSGIGVASPGQFGPMLKRLGASKDVVAAWADIDIAARIAADTGLPAMWVNDGNAAVWCETIHVPPPRPGALVAFSIGTFIGGGLVDRGELFEGPHGNAGDIGAIMVAGPSGKPESLHLLASLQSLSLDLAKRGIDVGISLPEDWDWAAIEPEIEDWLDQASLALAQATITSTALAEIEIVVFTGSLPASILARLVDKTEAALADLSVLVSRRPRLVAGHIGASAAALGAARLLLFRQYFARDWDLFAAEADK